MNPIWQLIKAHPQLVQFVAQWLFVCAVSSMPSPTDKSGPFYTWLFRFLHMAMGGIGRAFLGGSSKNGNGNGNGTIPTPPPAG